MIESFAAEYRVRELCEVYGVSRHGYDQWRKRQGQDRQAGDARLIVEIKAIHKRSRYSYGAPKITQALRKKGYKVNHKRVARLMKEHGIQGRRRKAYRPKTTDSDHQEPVAPNRLAERKGQIDGPDQVWASDITYIPTREGWLYLASVMDLFSRRIVGWACSTSLKTDFVNLACARALRDRRPPPGLISHSDRGVQYASEAHRHLLQHHQVLQSMSRKGNCYDNAAKESFFSLLKCEALPLTGIFNTRKEALAELFKYIETEYNRTRMHSSLGYLSPVDFENEHARLQKSA
jgi:transposase InsO family protein